MSRCVIAIDAGTTGVRSRAVYPDDRPVVAAYREFAQHYPRPGWVEHDPADIWEAVRLTLLEVIDGVGRDDVAAIGITNQRETVVAWSRESGQPLARAIVWQDRRTAERCDELVASGTLDLVRRRTGLVLDPYFSSTKMEWLLGDGGLTATDDLALATVDSWVLWNLTGGQVYATDPSNASRTMLYDIHERRWDDELCGIFGVPSELLAEVRPTSGPFGVTSDRCGIPAGIPVSGIAGDQQAALFGQACFRPGMAKNTYGTGSFVVLNVGEEAPPPADGLLTSVAWDLGGGGDGAVTYALEGSIFVTGAAIQWLRDGLGTIATAPEIGPLAASVDSSDGLVVVPAFTGLGSPWWDPYARGTVLGITRGTTRAHLARAVVESIALQSSDVVEAMVAASATPLADLRADGGAAAMDLLLQLQADLLGVPVRRPADQETTALGAAFLAGLAEGVWPDLDAIAERWTLERSFAPSDENGGIEALRANWRRAVERARGWADR